MFRQFFYFSRSDRLGLFILLALVFAVGLVRFFLLPMLFPPQPSSLPPHYADMARRLDQQIQAERLSRSRPNPLKLDSAGFLRLFSPEDVSLVLQMRRAMSKSDFKQWYSAFSSSHSNGSH